MSPASTLAEAPEPQPAPAASATAPPPEGVPASRPPAEREASISSAPQPGGADADRSGGLTRGDRSFLLVTGGLLAALSAAHWALLSGFGVREVEIHRLPERRFDFLVDINRATWVEWMQLENIGEATARKIVADRQQRGPFRSIEELRRVSGIGPKTLEKIRPYLTCSDCPAPVDLEAASPPPRGRR